MAVVVQRACLFSWCWGPGSGGGNNQPPHKSDGESKLELIPKPKRGRPFDRSITIPQGDFKELVEGDGAGFNQITSCTAVYVKNESGRVVIYHWPFTAVTESSKQEMARAVQSIGGSDVVQIKLFTKSVSGLQELSDYLARYTRNIETIRVDYNTEPIVMFNGEQAF